MTDTAAIDAYTAYGVDLIRTAGLLLRTTPSVIYRASILFQRFEASVESQFRARYIRPQDMPAHRELLRSRLKLAQQTVLAASALQNSGISVALPWDESARHGRSAGTEYLIPNHVNLQMRTGLVPLIDLHAPLDYRIHHLMDQEDTVYLVAACLLISAKMEDPSTRIRAIVNICMRLSMRRTGTAVHEQGKVSPFRYEDYKACVVEAEEVVLHQLGFQTFVEGPYKYILLYLNVLVGTADTRNEGGSATNGGAPSSHGARQSPALTQWIIRAVQFANDFPRCRQLILAPTDALAGYAIQQTCPPEVVLPAKWSIIFGIRTRTLKTIAHLYDVYRKEGVGGRRSIEALHDIQAVRTEPLYRTVAERDQYDAAMKQLKEAWEKALAVDVTASHDASSAPPAAQQPLSGGFASAATIEELRNLIGATAPPTDHQATVKRREGHDPSSEESIRVKKEKKEKKREKKKKHHRHGDGESSHHRSRHHRKDKERKK